MKHDNITDIPTYLRACASELGEKILCSYPPLHFVEDAPSAFLGQLLRKPFPAQTLAIMGVVKRWAEARAAAVIAECGTGKTLISLAAIHAHSEGKPFTALAMVPPQLVEKWAREAFRTLPRIRVFFIDGLRTPTSSNGYVGVNEVRMRSGRIVREGLRTSLTELRLRKSAHTPRQRWDSICCGPALFIVGRDRGKLSYFWRHAYAIAQCGRYQGNVINADTGCPIYLGEDGQRLLSIDFKKAKLSELLGSPNGDETKKLRRALYSALWQADGTKVRRFAPVDFIGRYMPDFFDYAIADEVHELKGDTAQGNALGTLAACAQRTLVLTGTLLGGYADELFNILFRLEPAKMVKEGFEFGEAGVRAFTETYGLLEKVTVIEPSDNACSEGRIVKRVRRRPGMLLQNLQLAVGKRYESEEQRRRTNRPIFSVVLDEFAPFGYRNFSQILQTARGTNTTFLFSMQSLPQLMHVGRGFKEDVTSAPNTTMALRTRDDETARYFLRASAEHPVTRRNLSMQRWKLFGYEKYEETGRAVDVQDKETRALDEHIKNLPKGQMEILMTDDTQGTLHAHLHVRPPADVQVPHFEPDLYPRLKHSRANSVGANLRFKTPELAAKRFARRTFGDLRI